MKISQIAEKYMEHGPKGLKVGTGSKIAGISRIRRVEVETLNTYLSVVTLSTICMSLRNFVAGSLVKKSLGGIYSVERVAQKIECVRDSLFPTNT